MVAFLDFTDVRSYLTFKISAWKRDCTISYELQLPQTLSNPFWKAFKNFYQVK